MVRLAVPPELRPRSVEPAVTKEKFSIASMGRMTPAIDDTPPWLTAGIFHQRSLLSVPSICQLTELERVPFTLATPAPPPVERPANPGVCESIWVKSRPLLGRFCTAV